MLTKLRCFAMHGHAASTEFRSSEPDPVALGVHDDAIAAALGARVIVLLDYYYSTPGKRGHHLRQVRPYHDN